MEVVARLNHFRLAPRKARLSVGFLKGLDVVEAQRQLQFLTRAGSRPILKLINSAVANAENNFELNKDNLYIKDIAINEGATLKRFRARAFGRAATIRKRSSHILVVLAEKKPTQAKTKKKKVSTKTSADQKIVSYNEIEKEKPEEKKPEFQEMKKDKKPLINIKEIKDKFIRRTGQK